MNQILPHRLWIGHHGEEGDFRSIFDAGIRAVVSLAVEEETVPPPRELIFLRFPLLDGSGNDLQVLGLAIKSLAALIKAQVPCLVSCGGGVSRAPAIAAAALGLTLKEPAADCLERVVAHHPCDVLPGLWDDVTAVLATLA
jgi:protein-tyrosine phosphatase